MKDIPIELSKKSLTSNTKPLVSISCITYNHINFIEEAIKGFLIQKTTFDVEILIHDDASTDGTQEIIKKYHKLYPNLIKPIFQLENQYSKGVKPAQFNKKRALGKYYAICEGDDYWTDPLKLQKQVDFLEENEEFSMCFHKAKVIDVDRGISENIFNHLEERNYTGDEILEKWSVPTASVVYRNDISLKDVSKLRKNILYGDILLFLQLADVGKLFCIGEEMSVYRLHTAGATNSKNNTHLRKIKHFKALKSIFYPKYKKTLNKFISNYSFLVSREAYAKKNFLNVIKYSIISMSYSFSTFNYFFLKWIKQKA